MARFVGRLAATLVCTTFVTVQFPTRLGQTQVQPEDVGVYAQKITVRIDGQDEGSGFIIEKSGNTYTVLTNWHVVDEAGTYSVTTVDGQKYNINYRSVQQLPGLDAARLQFESSRNYEQADFGNSDELSPGQQVFFAGYPQEIRGEPGRNYTFQAVSIRRILSIPNDKGYAIVYNGEALPGMSGGPVLNSSNNVIGIHGEANIHSGTRAVSLYAIPINLTGLQPENSPPIAAAPDNTNPTLKPLNPSPVIPPPVTNPRPNQPVNRESAILTATLAGHEHWIKSVAFSPNGKTLASASADKTVKLWNVETEKLLSTITGNELAVNFVTFSPDGKTLVGSVGKTIKLWNVETVTLLSTLAGHESPVWSISLSPNGKTLASASVDKTIKLWNVETGTLLSTLAGHENPVRCVAFSPDGKILASGDGQGAIGEPFAFRNGKIKLWNVETGELLTTLTVSEGSTSYTKTSVNSLAFSPDDLTLVSGGGFVFGSGYGVIKLWNVRTGELVATLAGHERNVNSVTFSPNGQILASGSNDKTIKLWNVQTRELLTTFTAHESSVESLTFSPDGKTLASSSSDKTIKLWRVP